MVETSTCVEGHVFTHSHWVGVVLRSPKENLDGLVNGRDLVLDVAAWNRLPRDGGGVRFSATVTTTPGVVDGFGIRLCARYEPSEIHRDLKVHTSF